jgi:hypothetical protein
MKLESILTVCFLLLTAEIVLAIDPPKGGGVDNITNSYRRAFIDVKDDGHSSVEGQKGENDGLYMEGLIWDQLNDTGIGIALNDQDKKNADLHVICRFEHKLMMPVITQGAQIKMSSIGKCSIKIIDKKTEKVLIEKSWVRGKKNGELQDFIKAVFAEFKKGLETNAVPQVPVESAPKMTNSVPLPPPQNVITNTGKIK